MKKIVWDLFGGLNGSLEKSLDKNKYEILTFDILSKTKDGKENIVIDLANENINHLINILKSYKKPDIITASPMCNSFSAARRYRDGGTGGWIIEDDKKIILRSKESFELNKSTKRNDKWDGITERAKLGKIAIENTFKIIEYFQPKYFYIENPKNSLIWNYIEYNMGINNYPKSAARYGSYDNFGMKKDTIFLSNIILFLRNDKWEPSYKKNMGWVKRQNRSDIPKSLLQHIFINFELDDEIKNEITFIKKQISHKKKIKKDGDVEKFKDTIDYLNHWIEISSKKIFDKEKKKTKWKNIETI